MLGRWRMKVTGEELIYEAIGTAHSTNMDGRLQGNSADETSVVQILPQGSRSRGTRVSACNKEDHVEWRFSCEKTISKVDGIPPFKPQTKTRHRRDITPLESQIRTLPPPSLIRGKDRGNTIKPSLISFDNRPLLPRPEQHLSSPAHHPKISQRAQIPLSRLRSLHQVP